MSRGPTARGAATRERILDVARSLLVREGPHGLRLRAVASEAEISLSNAQFHFADVPTLLRAILQRELEVAEAAIEAHVLARPDDVVGASIDALLELQKDRSTARLFYSLWAFATTDAPLRTALHAFYATFVERVAAVSGSEERAFLFVSLLEGASLFRTGLVGKTDEARERALREALRALVGSSA